MRRLYAVLMAVFIISNGQSFAENSSESYSASALLKSGISAEQKGNINSAVLNYSRALLIDSENTEAHQKLIALSTHQDLSGDIKLNIRLYEDLSYYLKNLETKVEYSKENINALTGELIDLGYVVSPLEKELLKIKNNVLSTSAYNPQNLEEQLTGEENPLVITTTILSFRKGELLDQLEYLKNQQRRLLELKQIAMKENHLDKLKNTVVLSTENPVYSHQTSSKFVTKKITQPPREYATYRSQGYHYVQRFEKQQQLIESQRLDISAFRNELNYFKTQITDLQLHIQKQDHEIVRLTGQLIDNSLGLVEKDQSFEELKFKLAEKDIEADDYRSRFELGQTLLAKKDQILKEKRQEISFLKNDFKLMKQSQNQEKIILNYQKNSIEKDRILKDVYGILEIYKAKFWESNFSLKQRNADVKTLEEQLQIVQTNLYKKNQELESAKAKIVSIENQLLENERNNLHYLEKNGSTGDYESELERLRLKLHDMKKYINDQMSALP